MTPDSLTGRLRTATSELHRSAEQSGIIRELMRGQIDRHAYVLLLRNLHALYQTMEMALDRHAASPQVAPVRIPVLYRAAALAGDLDYHARADWNNLPLTGAMRDYVARIDELSADRPALLAAHAYVRYLGDLSGGQVLARAVRRNFDLPDGAGAAFYGFGSPADPDVLKRQFRQALDDLPVDAATADAIVAEASQAFNRHIALFAELDRLRQSPDQVSAPPPAA
jgi:heme oxygenase